MGARVTSMDVLGITLGDGNWASAYRQAVGDRREALRLLCQSGVVTAHELVDDLTVVPEEHIEECISIGLLMLEKWPPSGGLLPKEEAKAFFEKHLAQLYVTTPMPPGTDSTMFSTRANIRKSATRKGDRVNIRKSAARKCGGSTEIEWRWQNRLAKVADISSDISSSEEDAVILTGSSRKRRKGTKLATAQAQGKLLAKGDQGQENASFYASQSRGELMHHRLASMTDTFLSRGNCTSSGITSLTTPKDDCSSQGSALGTMWQSAWCLLCMYACLGPRSHVLIHGSSRRAS